MPEADYGTPNRWLTVCTINPGAEGTNKDDIISMLENENIEARPVWKPMHLQPLYRDCLFVSGETPSVSEKIFNNGLCLPSGVGLSLEEQERIISLMRKKFY